MALIGAGGTPLNTRPPEHAAVPNLVDQLRALPGEALVPVAWVLEQLVASGRTAEPRKPVRDLTVEEVSALVDRAPSTVRAWCASGRLAGAYRCAGREWRIPTGGLDSLRNPPEPTPSVDDEEDTVVDLGAWRSLETG